MLGADGRKHYFLREKEWIATVFDPAPEAIEYGQTKGLNVKHAGIDRMDVFGSIKFDVVMLKNVLEHMPNPL